MIKAVIAGVVVVVLSAGGYGFYVFYQKMQNSDVHVEEPSRVAEEKPTPVAIETLKLEDVQDEVWISSASKKVAAASYQFPSNVLDINIDVKRYEDLTIDSTKVLIKNLDDYKFFCLHEILRQKRVDFSYFKNKNSLDLLLYIPDETKRENILRDFRYYGIEYEISLKH